MEFRLGDEGKDDNASEDDIDYICEDFSEKVNKELIAHTVNRISKSRENRSREISRETRSREVSCELREKDMEDRLRGTDDEEGEERGFTRTRRRHRHHTREDNEQGGNMVNKLMWSTQSILSRVSSFFPLLRSFSKHSSDSGFQSLPPSRPLSRRSSLFSLGSSSINDTSDSDEEFMSHVKVVPGGVITDDYTLLELLGEGAFSKVYLAESHVDKGGLAAVKVINKKELCKDEDKMFLVEKEIEIMSQLDHPNIVKLYEVYVNSEEVCLVMELAKGGELFDKLLEFGSLQEPVAAKLMYQILEAVKYLHSLGIVHRDLKPENLLLYDNKFDTKVMVTDFGLSDYEEELSPESPVCGTATYLAPEVIKRSSSTRAQDMWSLGVISYIILCGYPPFFRDKQDDGEETELLKQIARGKYKFHSNFWDDISLEAKDFVKSLMCPNPKRRMTVEEALDHPWIKNRTRNFFAESVLHSLLQGVVLFILTISFFSLYFYILSHYFDIEYFFVTKVHELVDTGMSSVRQVFISALHYLSSLSSSLDIQPLLNLFSYPIPT